MEINSGVNSNTENQNAGGPGEEGQQSNAGEKGITGTSGEAGEPGAGAGSTDSHLKDGKEHTDPKSKGGKKGNHNKPENQKVIDDANRIGNSRNPRPTPSAEQIAASLTGKQYVNIKNLESGNTQENIPAATAANLMKHSPGKFELVD